jgi:hypothetical protein
VGDLAADTHLDPAGDGDGGARLHGQDHRTAGRSWSALVWGIDPGGAALEHDAAPAPDAPPAEDIPSRAERLAGLPPEERPPQPPF